MSNQKSSSYTKLKKAGDFMSIFNNISMQQAPAVFNPISDTANTTRVNFDDIFAYNVAVTNIIYPSSNISWRPNAVIMVPYDRWQYGVCASSIVHFPINAPIMFTDRNFIPPIILNEILRLSPTGDNVPAQILVVGPISSSIENALMALGFSTYRITAFEDVYRACYDIIDFRFNVVPSESEIGKKDVMVISGEDYSEGIPAAFYAAHMDVPIILVQQNSIPQPIQNFILSNRGKNYFIVGSTRTVSENVEAQIRNSITGTIHRISGNDPYTIAINFARYQSPVDDFGWKNNTRNGWAFSFGELSKWHHLISSVMFAHLSKHTPLLLVDRNSMPASVREYVTSVNPSKEMAHMPPYMHSYILGSFSDISHETQVAVEEVMDIMSKMEH